MIVLYKKDKCPIEIGDFLGMMSKEYVKYEIKKFVCGGNVSHLS